jgi:hypothetical protein
MNDSRFSIKAMRVRFNGVLAKLRRYNLLIFIGFVALLYLLLGFRIQGLNQPAGQAADSQVKPARVLRIDPAVVKQLQSLQDNSVSVQALFDQARDNPF